MLTKLCIKQNVLKRSHYEQAIRYGFSEQVEAIKMQVINDVEFTHRGHKVQVSHKDVRAEYQGVNDRMFTVLIDDRKILVPGIWSAYKKASARGVELVIKALLDGQPVMSTLPPA